MQSSNSTRNPFGGRTHNSNHEDDVLVGQLSTTHLDTPQKRSPQKRTPDSVELKCRPESPTEFETEHEEEDVRSRDSIHSTTELCESYHKSATPVARPSPTYQRRGRFIIWPVSAEAPSEIMLPSFTRK